MRLASICLGLLAMLVTANARADAPSPLTTVRIAASLDPSSHEIAGEVVYDLRNTSTAPLTSLVFHLYLEAFRDDRSVFMRESGGSLRGVTIEGRGSETATSIRVNGTEVIASAERELVPNDFSQLRVTLPSPLPPGGTAEIRVAFRSKLPSLAARAGYVGDFHILAQWFPKLAKLESDGTWASFPYHGNGEFYADFARYEVELRAPSSYRVEGTGERVRSTVSGNQTVHRFVASPVHDAAYVAAPNLEVVARACSDVAVRVAYPPGFVTAAHEHADATCFGLARFGRWFGAYPYPTLTVVVPVRGASGGAGMEYPTAFLTDGPWFASHHLPVASGAETTFHELAHQWFQGIVASDEDRYPLLDEGLANFAGYEALAAYRGGHEELYYEALRPFVTSDALPPPSLPSNRYTPYQYGASVYGRSTAVLETLARTLGHERVLRAVGRYAREQRFAHPRPQALVDAFAAELGEREARWMRDFLLEGRRVIAWVELDRDWTIRARRSGVDDFPITVEIREGERVRRIDWNDGNPLAFPTGAQRGPLCVVIDPDRRSLLDPRRANDVLCTRPSTTRLVTLFRVALSSLFRGIGP